MPLHVRQQEEGVVLVVYVVPRASKSEVVGVHAEGIKIRLTAPPVEGAANAALVAFLAEELDVPKSQIEIIAGKTSRRKVVAVSGIWPATVEAKLLGRKG